VAESTPPTRHHFAPVFYLKRWTGGDGFLEQFSRPGGAERGVRVRRLAPAATGYRDFLYTMPGLPGHLEQQVETKFMQVVDDQAAKILERLEAGEQINWDRSSRSAWTRFILSLQLRTPADIAGINRRVVAEWDVTIPAIQHAYESLRKEGDPETFEEFATSRDPLLLSRVGMRIATRLIDHPRIGERINNMTWEVLDLTGSDLQLLTSDRAVEQVLGLGDPRSLISLPLGPSRLFVATSQKVTLDRLRNHPARDLVRLRNNSTVKLARDFVWAVDRSQQRFIEKHFGAVDTPTLGERLASLAAFPVVPKPNGLS
jgi:hypothetical protein